MKYKYTCYIICMMLSVCVFAQAPEILWTKTYGGRENDVGYSIQQTSDGGYIVAGYTESFGAGESDVWILRLDSLGDTLSTKTYGEAGGDTAASIQHTTDSGFIVVGTKNIGPSSDVWLLKIDDYGDTLWTRTFSPSYGNLAGSDVKQTNDGGYMIVGNAGGGPMGWSQVVLMDTDSLGDTLWTTCHDWRTGNAVWQTSDSNYVIAGATGGYRSIAILMKVDTQGELLWIQSYVGPCGSHNHDVLETADDCLTVCGSSWYYGIYLIRTDANGDTLWTKFFCEGTANSLVRTFDGDYIMAGETSGDAVCIKTDSLGDTLWTAVYGGPEHDVFYSVLQTSDNGYIMVGETHSFGAGNADVWIVKLGPDVGVEEEENIIVHNEGRRTTLFSGPLQLPEGRECRVFDITGRLAEPRMIKPGIYFIEVDGEIGQKVIKIR